MWFLPLLSCRPGDPSPPPPPPPPEHSGSPGSSTGHTGAGSTTGSTGEPGLPEEVLREGFLWGYPLVFSMRTTHERPYNRLYWSQERPDETADHVPNPDVLYGLASLDLSREPAVVHTTTLLDRYWSLQISDLYAENVAYLGTRATEGVGGDYLLVPPGWEGDPGPYSVIRASTDRVAVLGRIHVRSDAEVAEVAALTSGYWALPRSVAEQGGSPADVEDWPWPLVREDTGRNGIAFWDELSRAVELVPARPGEEPVAEALLALGIGPGRVPSLEVEDPELRELLETVPDGGVSEVEASALALKDWSPRLGLGTFEGDWLSRAAWAYDGWLTQVQEEAVYVRSALLDGTQSWALRFPAEQLPPAEAFWSVTLYTEDGHLVANALDRFSFQGDELTYGPDGSAELIFSPTYPGDGARNWLPTPDAPFSVALRLYLPGPTVLDGSWQPPPLRALPNLDEGERTLPGASSGTPGPAGAPPPRSR